MCVAAYLRVNDTFCESGLHDVCVDVHLPDTGEGKPGVENRGGGEINNKWDVPHVVHVKVMTFHGAEWIGVCMVSPLHVGA